MKTVLTTLAALGLMTGFAYAGCAGHTASKDRADQVAEAPADSSSTPIVIAN